MILSTQLHNFSKLSIMILNTIKGKHPASPFCNKLKKDFLYKMESVNFNLHFKIMKYGL